VSGVDVVVAGGGLAGSMAAATLAGAGLRVRLAERKEDPGAFNYCAEAVSHRSLRPLGVPYTDLVAAPIDGGILAGPEGDPVRLRWPGVGAILHRDRLMRRVFARAGEAGADTRLGTDVVGVERDAQGTLRGVRVRHARREETWSCRALVAADGPGASVGRLAGIDTRLDLAEFWVCAQYRMMGVEVEVGFPEFWIGDVHAPGGYAWVFPRGRDEANVGLAMVADRPSAAGRTATQWLKTFRRHRFGGAGSVANWITGGIPVLVHPPETAAQGVVSAGDAARTADPLSAAGIAEAMDSGRRAAQTVTEALRDDDLSAARLGAAAVDFRSAHPRQRVMARIRRVFDRLGDRDKARLVEGCRKAFHDQRIDDIDPLQMFVRLLRLSPTLLPHARHLLAKAN